MEKNKVYIGVDKKFWEEFKEYAKENGLKPTEFANKLLKKAFIYEKYGDTPFASMKTDMDKTVERVIDELEKNEEVEETVTEEPKIVEKTVKDEPQENKPKKSTRRLK